MPRINNYPPALTDEHHAWHDPGAPSAAGDPMGYTSNVPRVVYRGEDGHVYETAIYPESDAWGGWGVFDMTVAIDAPAAAESPIGHMGNVPRIIYRG